MSTTKIHFFAIFSQRWANTTEGYIRKLFGDDSTREALENSLTKPAEIISLHKNKMPSEIGL